MKMALNCIITLFLCCIPLLTHASEPIISHNVTIAPTGNPPVCPNSWKGNAYPDAEQVLGSTGETNTQTGPIVRSCESCATDPKTNNCVCQTCYDYYDQ